MIRRQGAEDGGQSLGCRNAACPEQLRGKAATNTQSLVFRPRSPDGFTLVEMIVVIVITGIIGGMVAMFIRAPMQGYVDSARRAAMTDIADTALRRMSRDLRLALPNSVRVTTNTCPSGAGTCRFLEFLPTRGGGRYRGSAPGNELNFSNPADNSFDVLVPVGVTATANDFLVIYNLGIRSSGACSLLGADAYQGCNRRPVVSGGAIVTFTPTALVFPFESPGNRFHVVTRPVTYVCAPVAGGGGTLRRYWGYTIQDAQPTTAAQLALGGIAANALLASNVGATCNFTYDPIVVAQRYGLVTMQLTLTDSGESVTLYNATHVSNEP